MSTWVYFKLLIIWHIPINTLLQFHRWIDYVRWTKSAVVFVPSTSLPFSTFWTQSRLISPGLCSLCWLASYLGASTVHSLFQSRKEGNNGAAVGCGVNLLTPAVVHCGLTVWISGVWTSAITSNYLKENHSESLKGQLKVQTRPSIRTNTVKLPCELTGPKRIYSTRM